MKAAGMTIEQTVWCPGRAGYRCTLGVLELVVVTTVGPRIASLRLAGGQNVLYEDTTDFGLGAWRLYGGHRFSTAPESENSYLPDNEPCEVRAEEQRLSVGQPVDQIGLRKSLVIEPSTERGGFAIRHVLENLGPQPWVGAAWGLTCVPRAGCVVIPRNIRPSEARSDPSWADVNILTTRTGLRYWTDAEGLYAGPSSPQWHEEPGHLAVAPEGKKGKIGLHSEHGWMALSRSDCTFVIRGPKGIGESAYPDGGCNLEVFTCPDYFELETLGPLTTLPSHGKLIHEESWQLTRAQFTPANWRHAVNDL